MKRMFVLGGVCCLALLSGCSTTRDGYAFMGIIEVQEGTYADAGSTSLGVRTEEITGPNEPSGDQISLFWGLINISDY